MSDGTSYDHEQVCPDSPCKKTSKVPEEVQQEGAVGDSLHDVEEAEDDDESIDGPLGAAKPIYRCEFWTDEDHGIYSSTDIQKILDKAL